MSSTVHSLAGIASWLRAGLALLLVWAATGMAGTPSSAHAASVRAHSGQPAALFPRGTGGAAMAQVVSPLRTYADLAGLPRRVDLSRWDLPPGDQGFVGSCAAWATTYSLVGWFANRHHLPGAPFAPMAVYHTSGYGQDVGSLLVANLIAGMSGLIPMGFYSQGNFDYRSPLTPAERRIARHYRISDWYAVYQLASFDYHSGTYFQQDDARHAIERSLAHGVPVVLSLSVFNAMQDTTAAHPYIGLEVARSGYEGGHAVFASRYDEHGLWIENEWGLGWGRNGYAELSWDFVNKYVDGALTIAGVAVDRGAPVPAVTVGPAHLQVSGVLRPGHEVVITGRGFRPGEVVTLRRDGVSVGRWPVTPWGTFQVEAYFHPTALEGPHNHHWTPGAHTLVAVGSARERARAILTVT